MKECWQCEVTKHFRSECPALQEKNLISAVHYLQYNKIIIIKYKSLKINYFWLSFVVNFFLEKDNMEDGRRDKKDH